MATDQPTTNDLTSFGANEWLVEDMYERYRTDPGSVDAAWHDFFDDYRPGGNQAGGANRDADADPDDESDSPAGTGSLLDTDSSEKPAGSAPKAAEADGKPAPAAMVLVGNHPRPIRARPPHFQFPGCWSTSR